jgi:uncharacterized protein (UPF0335 family)
MRLIGSASRWFEHSRLLAARSQGARACRSLQKPHSTSHPFPDLTSALDPRRAFGHRTALVRAAPTSRGSSPEIEMAEDVTATTQTVAAGQLRAFIERIEKLEEEKQTIADDIKDVYAELKGTGFDTKAVRAIVRLRKKDQAERQEEESILDLYKAALGMT